MDSEASARWEYRVVEPPRETSQKEARDPTPTLEEFAADGWELDETIDYVGGGTKFLVFRRPVEGSESRLDADSDGGTDSSGGETDDE